MMTPVVGATTEQRIAELEAAAQIADAHQDYVFARMLREQAQALREQTTNDG
jgi:hypothetical protein